MLTQMWQCFTQQCTSDSSTTW